MSSDPADETMLRTFLSQRDAPCPNCGYNLRALTADVCPECNAALVLRVGLVEPRLGAFLLGAIGLGGGLGFNGILVLYFMWMKLFGRRWGGPPWREITPLGVSLVLLSVLLLVWIRGRARLRSVAPGMSWALGAATWVVAAATAMWFFATAH